MRFQLLIQARSNGFHLRPSQPKTRLSKRQASRLLDINRELAERCAYDSVQKAVNDAIRSLNLTRIVIAHRPETIAAAERVIVLQGGKVVQDLRRVMGNERAS